MPLNSFCVNDSVLNRFMSFEERVLFHLYFSFFGTTWILSDGANVFPMLALLFVRIDLYFDFLVLEMDKKTATDVLICTPCKGH